MNFDELMRKKLSEKEFPFKDAYWEAAQQKIAKHQAGTKRRKLAGLLLLLLIISSGSGIFLWNYFVSEKQEIVQPLPADKTQIKGSLPEPKAPETILQKVEDNQPATPLKEKIKIPKEVTPEKNLSQKTITNDLNGKTAETPKKLTAQSALDAPVQEMGKSKMDETGSTRHDAHLSQTSMLKTDDSPPPPLLSLNELMANPPESIAEDEDDFSRKVPLTSSYMPTIPSFFIQQKQPAITLKEAGEIKQRYKRVFSPWERFKWEYFVVAGLDVATHFANDAGMNGLVYNPFGGVGITYNLNNRVGFSGSVNYMTRNGVNRKASSTSTSYGFGFQSEIFSVKPVQLHYLSVPLSVNYQLGNRHTFSVGLEVSALLNVKSFVTIEDQDNFETTLRESRREFGYVDGFGTVDVQTHVGYYFGIASWLQLGVLYRQGLMDITDDAYFNYESTDRNSRLSVLLKYNIR